MHSPPQKQARFRITNKWLILALLSLAYTLSFMDRYAMNILLEPIKKSLHLTDTAVSLLAGAGFAFFYALMALPLGRLADTGNRVKIMSAGVALWSLMTAVCGLSKNYVQLMLSRVGVGVGEASLSPSAYSLLTDYFPKKLLATAIGIYSSGIYIGAGLAYILGGLILQRFQDVSGVEVPVLGHVFPWQIVFFLFGIPGLLLAICILFIAEPERKENHQPSLSAFIQYLKKSGKPFLLLCAASAIFCIAAYATGVWIPAFLVRVHHLPIQKAGLYTGLGIMVLSPIGAISGGMLADLFADKWGTQARINTILISILLFIPACIFYTVTSSVNLTLLALVPYAILISAGVAVTAALVQEIVPSQYRGSASAVLLFSQNMIGLGIGPTSVALLTDHYFKNEMMIGSSLAIIAVSALVLAAILFMACRRSLKNAV